MALPVLRFHPMGEKTEITETLTLQDENRVHAKESLNLDGRRIYMKHEVEKSEKLMRNYLIQTGFDFNNPKPYLGWTSFKRFAALPVSNVKTVTIGFECINYSDRDDVLWLSFMRRFESPDFGWSCGCLFSTSVPDDLKDKSESLWWWDEHGTLEQWTADVEAISSFEICMNLKNWKWEGFSE